MVDQVFKNSTVLTFRGMILILADWLLPNLGGSIAGLISFKSGIDESKDEYIEERKDFHAVLNQGRSWSPALLTLKQRSAALDRVSENVAVSSDSSLSPIASPYAETEKAIEAPNEATADGLGS